MKFSFLFSHFQATEKYDRTTVSLQELTNESKAVETEVSGHDAVFQSNSVVSIFLFSSL